MQCEDHWTIVAISHRTNFHMHEGQEYAQYGEQQRYFYHDIALKQSNQRALHTHIFTIASLFTTSGQIEKNIYIRLRQRFIKNDNIVNGTSKIFTNKQITNISATRCARATICISL